MSNIIFRDVLFIALLTFVAMVVWMLPHLNPPADDAKTEPPGAVIAAITWPEGNIDVDLWLDGPGEPRPVGYSNKGGVLWNLLRDDLGNSPDYTPLNHENAFSRGAPPGDYRVNVHCFRCPVVPVIVSAEVSLRTPGGRVVAIGTSRVTLHRRGEEKTALAFRLRRDGTVAADSVTTLYEPLRARRGRSS